MWKSIAAFLQEEYYTSYLSPFILVLDCYIIYYYK